MNIAIAWAYAWIEKYDSGGQFAAGETRDLISALVRKIDDTAEAGASAIRAEAAAVHELEAELDRTTAALNRAADEVARLRAAVPDGVAGIQPWGAPTSQDITDGEAS